MCCETTRKIPVSVYYKKNPRKVNFAPNQAWKPLDSIAQNLLNMATLSNLAGRIVWQLEDAVLDAPLSNLENWYSCTGQLHLLVSMATCFISSGTISWSTETIEHMQCRFIGGACAEFLYCHKLLLLDFSLFFFIYYPPFTTGRSGDNVGKTPLLRRKKINHKGSFHHAASLR